MPLDKIPVSAAGSLPMTVGVDDSGAVADDSAVAVPVLTGSDESQPPDIAVETAAIGFGLAGLGEAAQGWRAGGQSAVSGAGLSGGRAPSDSAGAAADGSGLLGAVGVSTAPGGGATTDLGAAVVSGADTAGATTNTVHVTGSNIVFNNTFEASVTAAFENDIVAAEQDIGGRWTAAATFTLNLDFKALAAGTNAGYAAQNSWPNDVPVTYAQLTGALAAHDYGSSYAQAAVASLPATSPNGGLSWNLPEAYARMLGLNTSAPATDDTITLNTSFAWTYGLDVTDVIEHEISEGGMGRVGGLGDQNGIWSTMDLFRYSAAGVRDYSDGRDSKTTFFSYDGTNLSSLSYNNQYSGSSHANTADTADFTQTDVFGPSQIATTTLVLSQTDIEIIDALGWLPFGTTTNLPDLVVNTVSLGSTSLMPGGSTTISYHMENDGTAAAGASVSKVYLSTDNIIDTADTVLATVNDAALTNGFYTPDSTSITLPSNLAAGTYWIGVIADANGQVTESNESNNASTPIQITVTSPNLPDLVINTLSLSSTSLAPGDSITVSYHMENDGTGTAGASVSKVYLSTDNIIDTADTVLGSVNDGTLSSNFYYPDSPSVTIPSTLAPGTYYIGVIADATELVTESNESNNASAPVQITVTGPDLVVNSLSLGSTTLAPGGSTTVSYHMENDGTGPAGPSVSKVYLSTDNVITTSDTVLATVSDGTLSNGFYFPDSTTVTLPSTLTSGTYYIGVIADANGQVTESNENNNASAPVQITVAGPSPSQSPAVLNNFGWSQGWGSPNNPRLIADVNGDGTADYLGFGFSAVFIGYGGTFGSAGQTGPGFSAAGPAVKDFGTSEGYTTQVQRGAAATGSGVGDVLYGQGFAGVYWYSTTGETPATDAAGNTYEVLNYQSTPNLYGNFGSQQGWSPANGFQILKTTATDTYASILGFGSAAIVVGPQAFAPGATAASSYVIPFAAGNNSGWNQQTDIRTFTDAKGQMIDLNHDGIADFVGMGPQGLAFAFGNDNGPGGTYQLGALQNAQINGSADDLGDAQGWNNATTLRTIVADPQTGFDDIIAFGNAGVEVAMGQDPATHSGQPFGQLYLAMADFGANQGWSVSQTPRIVGDVNGDGIPDIVGFGAASTFVALGSRDSSGNLHFAMAPNETIGDFGYTEGWSGSNPQTVRALADFKTGGTIHSDLVLSGAANTQVWQFA